MEYLGSILSPDDNEELGAMIISGIARRLDSDHEGMGLAEVAALHNINLAYPVNQESKGLRGVKDGRRYIFLDAKRSKSENRRQFFLLFATFVWEDEGKANNN